MARLILWEDIEMTVAYVPTILRSMDEIKKAFGVGEKQIKTWVEQGAPIAVKGQDRNTRYSAELEQITFETLHVSKGAFLEKTWFFQESTPLRGASHRVRR